MYKIIAIYESEFKVGQKVWAYDYHDNDETWTRGIFIRKTKRGFLVKNNYEQKEWDQCISTKEYCKGKLLGWWE